jgi:hypothetical protein
VAQHHSHEFTPEVIAQTMALQRAGGITFWNFWSIIPYLLCRYRGAPADLVLAWGPYDEGYYRAVGFRFKQLVQVGVVAADGCDPSDEAAAAALRRRFAPSVEFVVTVFDSSFAPITANTGTHIRDFYAAVLDWVASSPHRACLVKPKDGHFDTLPDREILAALENRLEGEGRWIRLPAVERPRVAALAGDVVACYPINSAGVAAAHLAGKPTLHVDLGGLMHNALSAAGADGSIIFRDLTGMLAALDALERGERGPGDHGPWLPMIDPYGDGAGPRRAGSVLTAYLQARSRGLPAPEALAAAAAALPPVPPAPGLPDAVALWRQVADRILPDPPDPLPPAPLLSGARPTC